MGGAKTLLQVSFRHFFTCHLVNNITAMEEITLDDINLLDIGNEIHIAGTIWSGKGRVFVTLLPGKEEDFSNLQKLPMELPDWERFLKQADTLETEIIGTDPDTGKIIKSLFRKTQRQIDNFLQWAVFQRDQYSCRYCGRTGIPLTVDHIDLWENGGAAIEENLITACRKCNKDRGRIEYDIWIVSADYKKKSANLSDLQKQANLDIINRLPDLRSKRVNHTRSR